MRVLEAELLSSISPLSEISMLDELFERAARADDDQVITKPPSKRRTADHSGHEAAATASTGKMAPSIGLVTRVGVQCQTEVPVDTHVHVHFHAQMEVASKRHSGHRTWCEWAHLRQTSKHAFSSMFS